jgi:SulP family sulfate permease
VTSAATATSSRRPFWASAAKDLFAALIVSLAAVSAYVSAGTLLFQGPLQVHLPLAIGAALLGGAGLSLWMAARGSMPLASVGPAPSTVPVLAALTAAVAAECSPAAALPTALAALAITALLIGLAWWLMGRQRWGDVVRYIPYPVVGGFIASAGWLSLAGGMGVAAGQPLDVWRAWSWLSAQGDGRLVCGLLIGIILWRTTLRLRHPLALPAAIVASGLALLALLWAAGIDASMAQQRGWLPAPLLRALPAWPGQPELLGAVQWGVLAHQAGLMLSALIVATISLLLSQTSLEVAWASRADINRDLRSFGQANIALGLVGGLTGGLSVSRSVLNRASGAVGRGSGYALALICVLMLIWGGPVLSLLPRPLLGGLLISQGLEILKAWLADARKRLSPADLATVWSMVVVTALFGFLAAVCLGVLACCVSFAVASARLAPLRRVVSRAQWPTRVERAPAELALLREGGERALIVELQGVLFFGSAIQLSRQIEALLLADPPPARLLLDFQHVRSLDSSAAQTLARLYDHARQLGVGLELSQLRAELRRALELAGALRGGRLPVHDSIDAAVSAWDDAVLAQAGLAPLPLERWLAQALPSADLLMPLLDYFEPLMLAPGETLFAQGEDSDAMYLVQSGRLSAMLEAEEGWRTVRTIHAGGSIGEMGLFRGTARSAHVQAEQASSLLRLRRERLRAMEREHPALAAAVYRLFVQQLADRLDQSTMQLAALAR